MNVDEWKYRISDPAIGRFWQIDPLAEDYVYNGTYNFSENRIIDSAELEGLERIYAADGKFINQIGDDNTNRVLNKDTDINAQQLISVANNSELTTEERSQAVSTLNQNSSQAFKSNDEAAIAFSKDNHALAQSSGNERGAIIKSLTLTNKDGNEFLGNKAFILGETVEGEQTSIRTGSLLSAGADKPGELSGFVHTHQRENSRNYRFTTGGGAFISTDQTVSEYYKVPIYLSNDSGQVAKGGFHLDNINPKGTIIYTNPGRTFKKKE